MRKATLLILGFSFLASGVFGLIAPEPWYQLTPGVSHTGAFNAHFVRDVGSAYFACGAAMLWLQQDARAWPAALVAGLFQGLHALVHVGDALQGRVTLEHMASDAVLVVLPAILVMTLAWSARRQAHA